MSEMEDAQELIRYILCPQGLPDMQRLGTVRGGERPRAARFQTSGRAGGDARSLAGDRHLHAAGDYSTRADGDIDLGGTQLETIRQEGLENYLGHQIRG